MSDKEILVKYINFDSSCLTGQEKKKLRKLNYKFKDELFSLRGKIGTCPKIEVEIEVTDRSPLYKALPCQGRRQGYIRQGNEKIMLFGYPKESFSAYSSPCLLVGN